MRRAIGWMLLAAVPLALAADPEPEKKADPPEGFRAFAPKDKTFAVWLPKGGRTSERERTLTSGSLGRMRVSEVVFTATDGTVYAASSLFLSVTSRLTAYQKIELVRDVTVDALTAKILSDTELKPKEGSAREYVIQTGRGLIRLRVLALGSRIYQGQVVGTKEQTESKMADTFLASLEPTKPPAVVAPPDTTPDKTPPVPKGKMVYVKALAGDVHEAAEAAVKEKRFADFGVTGFKLGAVRYSDVSGDGGILIGVEAAQAPYLRSKIVTGVRPIYLTKDGEK